MAAKKPRQYPKPPLTSGGKRVATRAHDAPRELVALALTQVPAKWKGPAMRGAYARGWCDAVRGKKSDTNPYNRAGSGWQHAMAGMYADGWRAGKQVRYVERESGGMSPREYDLASEVKDRAEAILRGEIVGERAATEGLGR